MIMTKYAQELMLEAVGNDTPGFNVALYVWPIMNSFVETPELVAADLDVADFGGSGMKTSALASRAGFSDPATGEYMLVFNPPVGGYRWTTTSTANLPQTIYGVALGDDSASLGAGNLIGAKLFDQPVVLSDTGQTFGADDLVEMRLRLDGVY